MKPGEKITCKYAVEAYYSDYGVNKGKKIEFKPGMIGIIAAIAPKVTMPVSKDPRFDRKTTFLVVDYVDPEHGEQRVGLNFCNAETPTC
jgi:hypothetical protein